MNFFHFRNLWFILKIVIRKVFFEDVVLNQLLEWLLLFSRPSLFNDPWMRLRGQFDLSLLLRLLELLSFPWYLLRIGILPMAAWHQVLSRVLALIFNLSWHRRFLMDLLLIWVNLLRNLRVYHIRLYFYLALLSNLLRSLIYLLYRLKLLSWRRRSLMLANLSRHLYWTRFLHLVWTLYHLLSLRLLLRLNLRESIFDQIYQRLLSLLVLTISENLVKLCLHELLLIRLSLRLSPIILIHLLILHELLYPF